MKVYSKLGCVMLALLSVCATHAAVNDYIDDFSDSIRYVASRGYSLSLEEQTLRVDVATNGVWQGQYFDLGEVKDFTAAPWVSVKIRTMKPFLMTAYFFTNDERNFTQPVRVHASEHFVEYFIDFSSIPADAKNKITGMQLTVNGNSNGYRTTFWLDDLRAGVAANKVAGIGAIREQVNPVNAKQRTIRVGDLRNATAVTVTGADSLVENLTISNLTTYTVPIVNVTYSVATITYDCRDGVTGEASLSITAVGASGFANNTQVVALSIEPESAPTLAEIADMQAHVGIEQEVGLSGIDDGNSASDQDITFTVESTNTSVVPSGVVTHNKGSPRGVLSFTASNPGTTTLTVTASDGPGEQQQVSRSFEVAAFAEWNNPPTLDPILNQEIFIGQGSTDIPLTGISTGDTGQALTFSTEVGDTDIITSATVIYEGGTTAVLRVTPDAETAGTTTITVTATDNGAAAGNNGNQSFSQTFSVTTRFVLPDTLTWNMAQQQDLWEPNPSMTVNFEREGQDDIIRVTFTSKSTYDGLAFDFPDVDMSEYPVVTFDFRAENAGQATIFIFDNAQLTPEEREELGLNYNNGHSQTKTVAANQWQTLTFDFRGAGQMQNGQGTPLNASWITSMLFNYHNPALAWPFTTVAGSFSIRNLRFGEAALPSTPPVATINDIADRWHFQNPSIHAIQLSGISSGGQAAASAAVTSNNAALFSSLAISSVAGDGTAVLTYELNDVVGTATVTVTIQAQGSTAKTTTFTVNSIARNEGSASTVTIDQGTQYQTIYGFGSYSNTRALVDEYTQQLGGSAMRVGLIENQLELVNDNNDPYSLDRSKLNYGAFDWAYYRSLKEKGVETFILTSWAPPAWMKDNLSEGYGFASNVSNTDTTDNRLAYHYYEEFAESMVAAYRLFQEECGINLKGIGLQNEPTFHEPYPSAILDTARFRQLIKVVGARFEMEGIECELFMPEQVFSQTTSMNAYIDALNSDQDAMEYCKVVATHGYASDGVGQGQPNFAAWTSMYNRSQGGGVAKELWMTETYPEYSDYSSALNYAAFLYGALEYGQISLWTSWSYEGQFHVAGQPTMSLYTFSQFARHIRPGAKRIDTTAPQTILATSYLNAESSGGKLVTVFTNQQNTAQVVKLASGGGVMPASFAVALTDSKSKHRQLPNISSTDLIILPPRSVLTISSLEGIANNDAPVISSDLTAPAEVTGTTAALAFTATDSDGDALTVNWTVSESPAGSSPSFASGSQTSLVSGEQATNSVTFNALGAYKVRALVTDGNFTVSTREVTITVVANPTNLVVSPTSANVFINQTGAFEASVRDQLGGTIAGSTINWTVDNGSLLNNAGSPVTYMAPAESGAAILEATSGTLSAQAQITIVVPDNPPQFTISTLPNATRRTAYAQTILASGGEGSLAWAIADGSLPPGINLTAQTGRIAGTPSAAGDFTFTVTVTDTRGVIASEIFTLTVKDKARYDLSGLPSGETSGWINHWYGIIYYNPDFYPWTFHLQHGWFFPFYSAEDEEDLSFWSYVPMEWEQLEWQWLADGIYPFVYSTSAGWLYYLEDTTPPEFWDAANPDDIIVIEE